MNKNNINMTYEEVKALDNSKILSTLCKTVIDNGKCYSGLRFEDIEEASYFLAACPMVSVVKAIRDILCNSDTIDISFYINTEGYQLTLDVEYLLASDCEENIYWKSFDMDGTERSGECQDQNNHDSFYDYDYTDDYCEGNDEFAYAEGCLCMQKCMEKIIA